MYLASMDAAMIIRGWTDQKFTLAEVDLQQNFTKEKGELSIPVSTTLDASRWDVASNQDWCIAAKDLSTSKPSIKILVKASEEPEIREAVVTVKSLVKNYEIHVKQLGYGPLCSSRVRFLRSRPRAAR